MSGFLSNLLGKIFGNKYEKDIKEIEPIKLKAIGFGEKLKEISNDALRNKTAEFKKRIADYIQEEQEAILEITKELQTNADIPMQEKDDLFEEIEKIKKIKVKKIEEILLEILPEAFAVMKETARRFTNNVEVEVTANEHDMVLADYKANVLIKGDKAFYQNTWLAAGSPVTWNMVHYDVQLIGGTSLHQGKIAEMATGEGKTLVATLPLYLNALPGEGIHVVTVNDYLARRDSEWMGPIFEFHGLTIDCIDKYQPNSPERRNAYACDITYGTNNEFGFDYLRDNMVRTPEEKVQRGHNYAIVDEVDSVLIDDARTPLIISGPTPQGEVHQFIALKGPVEQLVNVQRTMISNLLAESKKLVASKNEKEAGVALLKCYRGFPKHKALIQYLSETGIKTLLQKTENEYLQDNGKEMKKIDQHLYFIIDEKLNSVDLTEKGTELISKYNSDNQFFVIPDIIGILASLDKQGFSAEEKALQKETIIRDYSIKSERIHTVSQLLKAYTMFEIDVEYVLMDGKVKIVDEQTGRILEGRRYSDGLHQAIEAKEDVKIEAITQTYATITLQNYFRMYNKLGGMTGTAMTEAGELYSIYKLDVVSIPTNRPIQRKDHEDLVYKTKREKYNAVIDEIAKLREAGRPILVGTTSVEISEYLGRLLEQRNIPHNVLNAKLHQREAEIVAAAGQPRMVTIATNMAGRGTDIKLGEGVAAAGGLAIIGTERHESRRVDRQLRGRAGRQGDTGSSQFFVSLEDDLMRLFGSEKISSLMDRMGLKEGEVIQSPMITKSIERAQKKVEENNFGVRKRLLEYDDVMNNQRTVIYKRRNDALSGDRLQVAIADMFYEASQTVMADFAGTNDYVDFEMEIFRVFNFETQITAQELSNQDAGQLTEKLYEEAYAHYEQKNNSIAGRVFPAIENIYQVEVLQNQKNIENVVLPITDAQYIYQTPVNLTKALQSKGQEINICIGKMVTLNQIDENWKEHLRDMDDLRQSVQNAVYEQKDPLLIYKFEAFDMFKNMLVKMSKEVITSLSRSDLYMQPEGEPTNAPTNYTDTESVDYEEVEPQALPSQNNNNKIGRNDLCPCGSGQKYKYCHGAA